MDEQHVTLLVLLDLSAAFDTIHHDKLIGRLESDLGITDNALAWFKSYLSDRFQRVSVNGSLSDQFPLCVGLNRWPGWKWIARLWKVLTSFLISLPFPENANFKKMHAVLGFFSVLEYY